MKIEINHEAKGLAAKLGVAPERAKQVISEAIRSCVTGIVRQEGGIEENILKQVDKAETASEAVLVTYELFKVTTILKEIASDHPLPMLMLKVSDKALEESIVTFIRKVTETWE